ncbi:MAG: phosphate ABC transporter substrate-binding protein [Spirochaetia bacterium]
MKKLVLVLSLVLLSTTLLFAGGDQEEGDGFSGDYAFGGSTTVDPIITAAIEEWKDIHPNVHISYEGVGSSNGIKGVLSEQYSLGGASREPRDTEIEQGVKSTPISMDAVAVIVNKESVAISNLSLEEVAKIYAKEITNWSEVGGPDAEIVVFNRDEASGTYETFEVKVMKAVDKEFSGEEVVVTSNGDMVAKVGSQPNAIGYCGLGYLEADPGIKAVTVDGIPSEIENVYDGSYPIWRYLNVVYTGELEGVEEAFVEYLLSDDGQAIVEEVGFIALPE